VPAGAVRARERLARVRPGRRVRGAGEHAAVALRLCRPHDELAEAE